jgi:hypothetical protein
MSVTPKEPRPRIIYKAVVICKGCGKVHVVDGTGMVPIKWVSRSARKFVAFCPKKGADYPYTFRKETREIQVDAHSLNNEERLPAIENRLNALEAKYQATTSSYAQELEKATKKLTEAVAALLQEEAEKKKTKPQGTPLS